MLLLDMMFSITASLLVVLLASGASEVGLQLISIAETNDKNTVAFFMFYNFCFFDETVQNAVSANLAIKQHEID